MNIKKSLAIGLFTTIFIANNYIFSMQNEDYKIVPNASYYVFKREEGIPIPPMYIFFYTFDGDEITSLEYDHHHPLIKKMLDQNAQKPQPSSFKFRYWDGITTFIGQTECSPGLFIDFYDKNGNIIKSYNYNKNENIIIIFTESSTCLKYRYDYSFDSSNPQSIDKNFPLDLSKITSVE